MNRNRRLAVAFAAMVMTLGVSADDIRGRVIDAQTKMPLIGATVSVEGLKRAVSTDTDGKFVIKGLKAGRGYTLVARYVSYANGTLSGVKTSEDSIAVEFALNPSDQALQGVTVTGVARRNTAVAMVQMAKNSPVIVSNISAQEISRTQDSNAGEVIRRVPGVSLIDDRFVMVRGLSQRYNNVWINGGAAPSSEADSRAFSFDLIPSAQIDNMQIIKTPSPEYPADYTGGFVSVTTKDIPSENTAEVSLGGNWNDATAFAPFSYAKGSGLDFLGFDGGLRGLSGGMGASFPAIAGDKTVAISGNGFNNDWRVRTKHPAGDLKFSASLGRKRYIGDMQAGLVAALNYTNEYRRYDHMTNNLFGVYDADRDRSNYLRRSTDDQYNHNVRLGAMLNLTLLSAGGQNKYQFKNIFNQIGNDRYTWREGISAQSDNEQSAEYYYRSRTAYTGQFTGKHALEADELDWSVGYSYANRNVPDRRRYLVNDALEPGVMQLPGGNDITREWTRLNEHIVSAAVNDRHDFLFGTWAPSLKVGAYGEYRKRDYTIREMIYNWDASNNTLPDDFRSGDITALLSNEANFGADKLYMLEEPQMRNNYEGKNTLGAAYFAATLPFGPLSVYAGLRLEYDRMELITNTSDYQKSPMSHVYEYADLFPSANATYKFNDKHQLRASYGRSVNRPEFREVSPSVFYDFDLASNVQGNTTLTPCYVNNIDLRYEFYPSRGEVVSLAAFYKNFDDPIEWTYTVTGGTDLIYSYINAGSANAYGLELDIRKDLSFIGLEGFSWSFNGALIKSRVKFDAGSVNENRPMQGQSPYLINTGIFYKNERLALDAAVMYNRIGKRIIGVGRTEGSSGHETLRVPDSYEMPRDMVDISIAKRFGRHFEFKISVRDLLAQKVYYKQFADVHYADGSRREVEQITRAFRTGRNFGITAVYKF